MNTKGILREQLPVAYRTASDHSKAGQKATTRGVAAQLIFLLVGAILGAIDAETSNGLHLGALSSAVALIFALLASGWLALRNPQRSWYLGRAAAESIKSLAWKYGVRAAPFTDSDQAGNRLESDIVRVKSEIAEIPWKHEDKPITEAMSALRGSDLRTRRTAYIGGRLVLEQQWYSEKAETYTRKVRRWALIGIAATGLGLVMGFMKAFGVLTYDGLGAASAIAAAVTAWIQLKQFRPLTAAYLMTARELSDIIARLRETMDEATWAIESAKAEEAISKEHTMWIARHPI